MSTALGVFIGVVIVDLCNGSWRGWRSQTAAVLLTGAIHTGRVTTHHPLEGEPRSATTGPRWSPGTAPAAKEGEANQGIAMGVFVTGETRFSGSVVVKEQERARCCGHGGAAAYYVANRRGVHWPVCPYASRSWFRRT
jgi:hypothetical protein